MQNSLTTLYSNSREWTPSLSLERNFMAIMNPDKQAMCAANPERCYFGVSPSLAELTIATSSRLTQQWLAVQLDNVLSSLGAKDNVDQSIINSIAQDIMFNYSWLNTSEFMLFCSRTKVGKYGQLAYGSVTVNDITSKMPSFLSEREKEMQRYSRLREQEERDREYAERQRTCVTHDDAIRIINAAADGDVEAQKMLNNDPENWKRRVYNIEWKTDDAELKKRITEYFGVYRNLYTKQLTACFDNERYVKFLEGVEKGFYEIIN